MDKKASNMENTTTIASPQGNLLFDPNFKGYSFQEKRVILLLLLRSPTDPSANLEPYNLSIEASRLHQMGRSLDWGALKLRNGL